jgi:large subunit ribosomal protein L3
MRGIIGRKLGMTRVFDERGHAVAATIIEAGPCLVTQIKTKEHDGYDAIQLGFGEKREKLTNKPEAGHLKKNNIDPVRVLKEFRSFESKEPLKEGDHVLADIFVEGEQVDVTGITKGKGFAGVVKRHGFGGGPKTHGQSDRLRAPGSLGQSSYPSRVFKGLKMAGRMGNVNLTTKDLKVLKVDPENNILVVKGAVPGATKGIVLIKK